MKFIRIENFEQWRYVARTLIADEVAPDEVQFGDDDNQLSLFADEVTPDEPNALLSNSGNPTDIFHVPREFPGLAETVSYHRDSNRWNLLYRVLWRITQREQHLLEISTDDDVLQMRRMEKEVRRDAHKMKAFVRFRKIVRDETEYFIAWHRPDHRIVRKVAPFFSRRFKAMNWTILTPLESAVWDQQTLQYGPGVPRSESPEGDVLEDLWRTYYASIFNPARVKVKMMKSEMPVRHWSTLPEADIVADLLEAAPQRVEKMIAEHEGFQHTAANIINDHKPTSLSQLADLAATCRACDLHAKATRTVFGSGPAEAKIVFVGEQPGDQEDIAGEPFVGPAGKILNTAMQAAGIDRSSVYVTNVVKHFKHTISPTGKKRLHQKPNARESRCCVPWFDAEWSMLREAQVLVCLGATAATAIIGPEFRITNGRGKFVETRYCRRSIATWHPSAILRQPDTAGRESKMFQLVEDLKSCLAELNLATDST